MYIFGTTQWKLKQYIGIIEVVWVGRSLGGGGWGRSVVRRVLRKNPSWGTWWMQRMDIFQNKTMINIECTSLYQQ